jgi:hypothetical protein
MSSNGVTFSASTFPNVISTGWTVCSNIDLPTTYTLPTGEVYKWGKIFAKQHVRKSSAASTGVISTEVFAFASTTFVISTEGTATFCDA